MGLVSTLSGLKDLDSAAQIEVLHRAEHWLKILDPYQHPVKIGAGFVDVHADMPPGLRRAHVESSPGPSGMPAEPVPVSSAYRGVPEL
jgi:hypothetical protein